MTDTELLEIRARDEDIHAGPHLGFIDGLGKAPVKDIPALLPLVYEQQVEIEHLKRALDWACQHGEKLCARFAAIAENGCFDCSVMSDCNSITPAPICKGWKQAALDATKEASSE